MGPDSLWSVSRFGARTYFVQHFSQWLFSYFEWYWHCHSYVVDNTLYKACENVDAVVKSLRMSAEKLLKWFKHDQMKGNTCKCHLILLILRTGDSNQIQIENSLIKNSLCEKILVLHLIINQLLISTSQIYVKKQMQN